MTALSDDHNPGDGPSGDDLSVERRRLRQRVQHQRAKRLDRRDPARTLAYKRARHEILSRV
jgi:hypothetical protein